MLNTLSFDRSLLGSHQSKINAEIWNTVVSTYEEGDYLKTLELLFNYIDSERFGDLNLEQTSSIEVAHGSVVLEILIEGDSFRVSAPFVKLPEKGSIPLLRQVAQLNFHPITLANIILDDNEQLTFYYECPLELCEPYKIYNVLREICVNADKYDDMFISKFKAAHIHEPKIEHYPQDRLEQLYDKFRFYIEETEEYIAFFENKRWDYFVYDVLQVSLMRMDYFVAPQGYLRTLLEDQISSLYSDSPFNERIHKAKMFLTKLKGTEKDKILEDLYIADIFIPYKYRSEIENIRRNFQEGYEVAKKEMSKQDYIGATFTLLKDFYRLFYYNNMEAHISELIISAMENSSSKPWEDSAKELFHAMETLIVEEKYNSYSNQTVKQEN